MEWISVKDRLPELGQWVLAYKQGSEYGIYLVKYFYNETLGVCLWYDHNHCGCYEDIEYISNWMPLPNPPEEL